MALEDIFKALEEQADRDIVAVTAEAREHAAAILDEAEREADTLKRSRVEEAERLSQARGRQTVNTARLEARKEVASVKDRAVVAAFADAREALADVRTRDDYDTLFRGLLREAVEGVGDGGAVLVDSADVERARGALDEFGIVAEVRGEMHCAGGVVVELEGGRVLRRNTLEDRLDKFAGVAQASVAEILFA
ncbi:MAG: V-type ATP synthase subunit E [Coriobacteriia bacterium]|nr:V-type ATP synthase subunit E [Coriobacteriia bacterium]